MSESTPNPSTSDPTASESPDASSAGNNTEPTAPQEAPTTTVSGKRKRKRKRKRKSPNTNDGSLTASEGSSSSTPTDTAQATPGPRGPAPRATQQGPRQDASKHGQGGPSRKKPPFEARRAAFRESSDRSGRHEFLSTWRWQPSPHFLELLAAPKDGDAGPSAEQAQTPPAVDTSVTNAASTDTSPAATTPVAATAAEAEPTHASPTTASGPTTDTNLEPDATHTTSLTEADTAATNVNPSVTAEQPSTRANSAQKPKKPSLYIPTGEAFAPWLSEAIQQCDEAVRVSLLVSLCSHRAFRQQGANSSSDLLTFVEGAAAVYDALFLDSPPTVARTSLASDAAHHDGRDALREGLARVCEGSMELVRVWPQAARERLFELATDFELHASLYENGAQIFHDSPKQLARVNLARICDALATGNDASAKTQIEELKSKAGAPGLLPLLSEALDGQRFGNLVVLSYGGASSRGADPRAPKRHSGFCLESQRDVWIRSGETHESPAFEHYSQLHRKALIPSVVGLYTFGVTRSRKPYLSVLRKGISLQRRIEHSWGLSREAAVRFAMDLTLLASALCRAGVRLPDLDARRFEVDDAERLWLSDLWGAELIEPRAQDPAAVATCRESVVTLLSSQPGFALPNDWREVICHSADFETLIATLRTLEKSRHWGS